MPSHSAESLTPPSGWVKSNLSQSYFRYYDGVLVNIYSANSGFVVAVDGVWLKGSFTTFDEAEAAASSSFATGASDAE